MKHRLLAAFALVAAITGFYWKLAFSTWLTGTDSVNQVVPWQQFQAAAWRAGHIPLWDPSHWFGQPLIGQAQPGVVSPLNWVLLALPFQPGWNVYLVLIHILAAAFAYRLARELGCQRAASVGGGLIFSLAAWMGDCTWPQMLNGAVWIPLVLLYLLRTIRLRRPLVSAGLGGFFLGLAWLSGHHQIPLFASALAVVIWIWALASNRRLIGACAVFWALAGMAGAAQILPAQEYGRLAVRWVGTPEPLHWNETVPYAVHAHYSLHPASLLGLVLPYHRTHPEPYLGVTALLLATLGLISAWRRPGTRMFAAIALGGLLFAMAPFGLIHGVIYGLVPHLEKARNPSAATFLLGLGAAMLAALGLNSLPRWGALALTALFLVDISTVTGAGLIRQENPFARYAEHNDIADFLRHQPGHFRTDVDNSAIAYNFGDWHNLPQAGGYLASLTENVQFQEAFSPHMRRLLGIAYAVRRTPDEFYPQEVFSGASGIKVYRHPDVLARAFSVHQAFQAPTREALRDQLYLSRDELDRKTFLLASPPQLDHCAAPDQVQLGDYAPERVSIHAVMACTGMVILTDTFYPGWQARVDGRPAAIHEAYGFLRGVVVPAGRHAVEFRYRPRPVWLGVGLSALAALIAAALALTRNSTAY
jgi:hypothetical protein